MVHQWGFFGSISAIRKIWSLTANSRSLQAAALKKCSEVQCINGNGRVGLVQTHLFATPSFKQSSGNCQK